MNYTIQHISEIISGELHRGSSPLDTIEHLLLDSRQIIFPKTALFFAIVGQRHNGHQYLSDLYQQGLRNFVIAEPVEFSAYPKANFVKVANTLTALQTLTIYHRHQFSLQTIGITGSNGKTIIKEWLFQLLQTDFQIVRSPKSYNSQIGVPLSIWQIQAEHNLGIFEAGISKVGEMEYLQPIIDCKIGLFTNIGQAHAAGFTSIEEKVKEKLRLFEKVQTIIYCQDYAIIHNAISKGNKNTFTWSKKGKADLQILNIQKQSNWLTQIEGLYANKLIRILIPFIDEASIENAIHCWALLLKLGYSQNIIAERIQQLEPVGMRLQLMEGINQCTLINDSYNSDLNSLNIALNFLEQQIQGTGHRTLILSDILQAKQDQELLYKQVADLLVEKKINRLFAIGSDITTIQNHLLDQIEFYHFNSTEQLLKQLHEFTFEKETILLKGARQFQFERIADSLSQKVHQTLLEVNLSALLHNLNVYHSFLKPNTKMMVMVKAAAYGSGSLEVARLLEFSRVDYLAVAYADEGIELRKKGIQLPILVLNPEEAVFDALIHYKLEPEIYSFRLLEKFAEKAVQSQNSFPIHIKLETGMNRLGFSQSQLQTLAERLKQLPQLKVETIFSHLAASEAVEHDTFTAQQVNTFHSCYELFTKKLGYQPDRHILNSAGINRFPEVQMEMVRLGIGLYGIDNTLEIRSKLKNVLQLKARISQIKTVKKGQSIGYGRSGRAETDIQLATVSIGYADGLARALGNRKHHLFVKGLPAPIIGNVCMDMCMVDISHIKDAKEGDEVIIFESVDQLEAIAAVMQTIPYEVLTNISPRVKRIYIQE